MEVHRISGQWQKLEMKTCVHYGGHVDGTKYKKRVCPGPLACQVLANNGVKLIKVSAKVTKTPAPPVGASASVIPPVPSIPEEEDVDPEAKTAVVVDTSSVDTSNSFVWQRAEGPLIIR